MLHRVHPVAEASDGPGGVSMPVCRLPSSPKPRHYAGLCSYSWAISVSQVREDCDVRVMQLAKQRREGTVKVVTGKGGVTRYEARLDSKKHRTTSRRKSKQSIWDHKDE